jgi:predicted Zn finger-like uncharacterized protein
MRLVCEKCSAIYTIEDTLVGDRDFRVSCKQCGTPIVRRNRADTGPPSGWGGLAGPAAVVGQATTSSSGARGPLSPRPPRPPASFAPTGTEEWFVWIADGQRGPYKAGQVAGLIEQGEMDWATQVWREGFRDWRPARRDATLVTAVADTRGVAGDTMRLSAARSFLAPEDTIVESRAEIFAAPSSQRISLTSKDELLSSTSDTQAIDARDLPDNDATVPGSLVMAGADARPQQGPVPPPQQWNTPENAAFRAGLGLPSDTRPVARPGERGPAPTEGQPVPATRTLGSAFRSAPSLMRVSPSEVTAITPGSDAEGWLPKPQSLLAVAALAFAGGVLAAAIASRYIAPSKQPAEPPDAAQHERAAPQADRPAAAAPAPAAPAPAVAPSRQALTTPPVTGPMRDLPEPEELRTEVRRVAPEVKRCIVDPRVGVEVAVFIDGPSGRVRDVNVRSTGLSAGRVDCVIHAVRQMQLKPFKRDELKLEHKFSW